MTMIMQLKDKSLFVARWTAQSEIISRQDRFDVENKSQISIDFDGFLAPISIPIFKLEIKS